MGGEGERGAIPSGVLSDISESNPNSSITIYIIISVGACMSKEACLSTKEKKLEKIKEKLEK